MTKQYQGYYILDIQGKEEGIKEATTQIEKLIKELSGEVLDIQKLDRRKFERVAGHLDSGFYVRIDFKVDGQKLASLREKLSIDNKIYRQFYFQAPARSSKEQAFVPA
jgi:small subunit ribosomal protein S6